MALITCPECGSQVSDKADKCPKCAYPINQLENTPVSEEDEEEIISPRENKGSNSGKWTLAIIIAIGLGITLPFHYIPSALKVFPKDNLTFSYTIITQDDIDDLIKRYNGCETVFQQESIRNEPLFRKLSEQGIIYDEKLKRKVTD